MAHTLAPLPYDYAALEPYIDAQTMQLHHDKHHAAYVNNLNAALEKYPDLMSKSVEELIINLEQIPSEIRTVVRNNAGGHFNHTLFWKSMSPNGSKTPTGAITEAIEVTFSSFDNFKQQFNEAGMKQFGSGWVWLTFNSSGRLEIVTTPNQDSPLTSRLYPLLGNDVWEHAYYLKYQNRRKDYLDAWWNVVDWDEVNRRFETARQ
ncbi:superoxide dismutase [Chlorogloeopsis sp. ULAP01]|uniref:superoxide dismutase n=1 Tax=Chlorogloeopsis sp. ULAP01 TaxID=3056483 RepID=UPI0025AACEE6|nr:superoxide dismutase [Chlorogloeopsis sp. ULAP01]MDM9380744.1 superoxide dismutase [Chlorogloeopsis sp. ULAP01]